MELRERLRLLAAAQKEYVEQMDKLEQEHGIAMVGRFSSGQLTLWRGIEKIEALPGTTVELMSSEYDPGTIKKQVALEDMRFYQTGYMRDDADFMKAKEIENADNQ